MDISNHITSKFLKPAHLASGPRRAVIAEVRAGQYQNPDCEFQDGGVLTLNATNLRALADAWGTQTEAWIGKEVELYAGKTEFKGEQRDSVLVRPISPPIPVSERPKPVPKPAADMNDEIPF